MDSHCKTNMTLGNYGHRDRSSPSAGELKPTIICAIFSTKDALLLVQKCIEGKLPAILRRPHDRERLELVKAGHVFVYNETDSGIKRWTDGINWSPSRILNNFLVYRELDKSIGTGEKKKATKRPKRYSPYDRNSPGRQQHPINETEDIFVADASRKLTREEERMLVGSLNESYPFKVDGLIKKTFSITFRDIVYHVVWYFSYLSYIDGGLQTPTMLYPNDAIYPDFVKDQTFRVQIDHMGMEVTGSTRDRALRDSASRSPALEHDMYQQNPQLGRYAQIGPHSYAQYQQPAYQFHNPLNIYHSRPQQDNYALSSYYQENTHNSYTPQEPRSYAGHSTQYATPNNEYTDSIHQHAQMAPMTSPHRLGPNPLYFPAASSETVESSSTSQPTRMRAGISSNSAMQHLAARAEDISGTFLNSSNNNNNNNNHTNNNNNVTSTFHHGAEYAHQPFQVSTSPPVNNTGLMNNAGTRNERNENLGNNGNQGQTGPARGHINRGYNSQYYPGE